MNRLIYLFIMLSGIQLINSCGVVSHSNIGNKALYWLENDTYKIIINGNLDVFYAALMFPDWGYNCPIDSKNSNASETAHWLPFQIAAIKYLHQMYSQPWNVNAEKLITFIYGVMSHSVADIIWHNLRIVHSIDQGFIQAIANSDYDFNGNGYDNYVHSLADIGGEFMTSMQFNLSYLGHFSLPHDDIVAIYQTMGINITNTDLLICMDELYLETELIRHFPDELIYPYYSEKAPFLTDYFQDWWLGGINSLSAWTLICWENLAVMIDNNTNEPCYIYLDSMIRNTYTPTKTSTTIKHLLSNRPSVPGDNCILADNFTVLRLNQKYSFLGTSFAECDINRDGFNEIILAAPGINNRGGIYVLFYNNTWPKEIYLDSDGIDSIFIPYNGSVNSRFGESLACIDINEDGYDDIVVGIAGYNEYQLENNGQIQIFFGNQNGINILPNVTINTNVLYANMGIKLSVQDNLLLIENYLTTVGNNINQGQLLIMSTSKYLEKQINCTINNCTSSYITIVNLESDYWTWNGFKTIIWEKYLIISEPLYEGKGRIYCYDGIIIWQISSLNNNSRFGFDMVIINQTLIVSSPNNSEKPYYGAVYFISLKQLFANPASYTTEDFANGTIYADQANTRFGWSLSANNDNIYIGEPNYRNSIGAIHILSANSELCYTVTNPHAYFGKNILATSHGVLVGAPLESIPVEHAGAVYLRH